LNTDSEESIDPSATGLPPSLGLLYPFRPRRVEVETGRLSVVDEGDGPAVVMVHGNPSWSFLFRDLILDLRGSFRCLAPDHQGCGLSGPQPRRLRMADHSANLGRVLDEAGVGEYLLVAHDWGGAIGAHRAGLEPDRVRGMVFLNTAAFPLRRMPWQIRLARVPLLGRILMERFNAFARGAVRQGVVRPLPPAVEEGFLLPWALPGSRRAVSSFVADIPMSRRHPTAATLGEAEANLAKLRDKPCLLAWGMRDFCFDGAFLDEWIRRFPEAEVERYPGAGHYVFEDAGAPLRDRIAGFAAEVWR